MHQHSPPPPVGKNADIANVPQFFLICAQIIGGIPAETFESRLSDSSAIHWVIEQYRVKVDKRSGIVNDPNRLDDEKYIVRYIGKVVTVAVVLKFGKLTL